MSNPFAAFRKNQKTWMAATVLLAILAFVVAPAIQQASQALSTGGDNATVVSWNGGKMSRADLLNNTQQHGNLVRFIRTLADEVIEKGGQPQVPGFSYDPQQKQIMSLGIQADSSDYAVCRTRILASYAKQLGVEFSDEAIAEFIRAYCDKRITDQRLQEILYESTGGRLTSYEVRELLKRELSAMVANQIAQSGITSQPPGKLYRDFKKLNQTARVEAFPVFVDDFLGQVSGEPSDAEIQAIYDAGAARPASPNDPQPGFGRTYQANIEYVEADPDLWIAREKANLSEEQLRAEYDRQVELGLLKVAASEPSDVGAAEQPAAAAEGPPAASGPTTTDLPAGNEPAEDPADDSPTQGSGEAAADNPNATAAEPGSESTGPESDDQSALPGSDVHYVSYVQQEGESPDDDNSDVPSVSLPLVAQPPQLDPEAPTSSPAAPAMRTKTFEEARDEIADTLARSTATPAMQAALTELIDEHMRPYFAAYRQYIAFRNDEALKDSEEAQSPPVKPDIKKLAEDLGLKYVETGMIDGYQFAQMPVGQANIRTEGFGGSAAQVVMNPNLQLFQPLESMYFNQAELATGNFRILQFALWKTEDRAAYIPELGEVRDEVVAAWKRQRAAELAQQRAVEISGKVATGDAAWGEAIDSTQQALVIQPDPFPWMMAYADQYMMTATVDKLDSAGSEFMQAVFSAEPGKTVVAPNEPHSVYYATRLVALEPPEDQLQERFNADPQKTGPMMIARQEFNDTYMDWLQHLERELDVQWEMPLN